jgi:hypothetical protein
MPPIQPTHHPRPSNPHPIATLPHPHSHPVATLTHSDSHTAATHSPQTLIFPSKPHNPHPAATNSINPTPIPSPREGWVANNLTPFGRRYQKRHFPHPNPTPFDGHHQKRGSSFHPRRPVISRRRDVIARRQKGGKRSSPRTKNCQKPTWRYQKHTFSIPTKISSPRITKNAVFQTPTSFFSQRDQPPSQGGKVTVSQPTLRRVRAGRVREWGRFGGAGSWKVMG